MTPKRAAISAIYLGQESGGKASGDLAACVVYCQRHGLRHGATFDDTRITNFAGKRPALSTLIDQAENGEVHAIVMVSWSSLASTLSSCLKAIERLGQTSVQIHVVCPTGRLAQTAEVRPKRLAHDLKAASASGIRADCPRNYSVAAGASRRN